MWAQVVLRVLSGLSVAFFVLKFNPDILNKLSHGLKGLTRNTSHVEISYESESRPASPSVIEILIEDIHQYQQIESAEIVESEERVEKVVDAIADQSNPPVNMVCDSPFLCL